ncbi:TPA: exodeoxyribonuclease V subunit beta [Pseudomonas aeruginosa]|uniref:exodeoxyribonuclease V subunit beta n=1 Tax=Pseudomonas aeruginosa TaxID=287 RepID=UPI0023584355|nr:exodeoxyribonuclease V subunit beta [Pseudomonas aeruginosa]MDU0734943.1 exodeoxyribonuclease V subunit beta [Pseudomonas aeruginosa]WCY80577.1 exodeoxyribonuclease V subunit beta [Pseudomonas aeruginosa]HBN9231475.1 exodeoxyribonuclease V subunit beta [Pseudomonas aeruginosa]HCF1968956.1 exodeoxyribonuclease V subunit beta [Pseudomonas aeruginosa]HCF4356880.1 exodeoxyribonuclease V subunit beta [Pseudomonas aeruginosa]
MKPLNLNPLDFPLHGSRLIEASAGTGKTFTIALLYVRLVLGHGGEAAFKDLLTPPQILVVTFTDAATQELRDRIRARLTEAARCFLEPEREHDKLLQQLRAEYPPQEWPDCARRLQLAGEWMDEAAVSTIHGWCYRMLREHAFDSGSLFTQTLETDQSELLAEVVRDYWRRHFYELPVEQARAIGDCFKSPQDLGDALGSLLTRRDATYQYKNQPLEAPGSLQALLKEPGEWYATVGDLERNARKLWLEHQKELEEVLCSIRSHMNGNTYRKIDQDDVFNGLLNKLAHWSRGQPAPHNVHAFGQAGIKLKGKAVVPKHQAFEAIDLWVEQRDAKVDIRAQLLLHALHEVRERFDEEKRRRAEIGFDDLLNRLDQALQGPSGLRLAETIRKQYPVALIDEFQDTDPVQYRIFETIYRIPDNLNDCGLFMIGDPKQAIYSFRGADIYTYLQAREATAGRHYTLGTNYRSTKAMVDAANHCFRFAEAQPRGAFRFATEGQGNPVPFNIVQANGRDDVLQIKGADQPALTFWQLETEGVVNNATYLRKAADASASAIQAWLDPTATEYSGLLKGNGEFVALRPADIAILVRNRKEAEAIRKALAHRQLASVYLSDRDSVFESEEAKDLLYILRACAQPTSDRLVRAAMATRSVGLTWQILEQLNQDELFWEQQVLLFRDFRVLWQQQGVLPMLRKLLATFKVPARLLLEDQGERRLTNLLHLAEWLQRSAAELDGEHALIRHFAEQVDGQSEEEILRLESDSDLIKVVTVHKSKGLEYPLVLLPFACSARAIDGRSTTPPMFHDDKGLVVELIKGDLAKPAQALANDERMGEEMRLLYVALTRARYATWICVAPQGFKAGGASTDLHKAGLGYMLAGEKPIAAAQLPDVVAALARGCINIAVCAAPVPSDAVHTAPPPPPVGPALRPLHKLAANWWIASYSALAIADGNVLMGAQPGINLEPATALEANLQEEDEAEALPAGAGIHGFPRGAGPGTFLHGLFEWAGREGFAKAAGDPITLHNNVARRCNLRDWETWIEPLSVWLGSYLNAPLRFNGTQCKLSTLSTYQVEMEFWFSSRSVNVQRLDALVREYTLGGAPRPVLAANELNGMFKGFIDLTFEHQGRYYVADYKSNWLGSNDQAYDAEAMAETMLDKRYDLQLCLYLLALHRQLKLRLAGYDYEQHMGGAVYLFVRGHQAPTQGVHFERPPRQLIEQLDQLFMGQHAEVSA